MIAYLDMVSGVSGDMFLGALIDLGVPEVWLTRQLSRVIDGFELETATVYPGHLRAVDVIVRPVQAESGHRHYTDIRSLIENAPLSAVVKQNSLEAFRKIALAESRIHGKDIETIHFHEVGGIDSIVDIIGTCLCMEYLGITQAAASPVPLGSGFVECAHGRIPVPVPATLEILADTPVVQSDATTEIVTPTGAALVRTFCTDFGRMPVMRIIKTGYGAGKRQTGTKMPNLLRIVLGEAADSLQEKSVIKTEQIYVIKTNIDDMNPEIIGFVMETLLNNQALDVSLVPVHMKKNRPGTQMEVLCRPDDLDRIIKIILTQTTSIGLRYQLWDRAFLPRETADIETRYGKLTVKRITNPDGSIRVVPEYETVKKTAAQTGIPVKDVYANILSDATALDTGKDSI